MLFFALKSGHKSTHSLPTIKRSPQLSLRTVSRSHVQILSEFQRSVLEIAIFLIDLVGYKHQRKGLVRAPPPTRKMKEKSRNSTPTKQLDHVQRTSRTGRNSENIKRNQNKMSNVGFENC